MQGEQPQEEKSAESHFLLGDKQETKFGGVMSA